MRNKRYEILLPIVLLCAIFLSSCGQSDEEWKKEIYWERSYAGFFWMGDSFTDEMYPEEMAKIIDNDPKSIKKIVYLDTDSAGEFDKSIMAFYPTNASLEFVGILTLCAEQDKLDLSEYGLSNPVTLDEVLTKRQEVSKLIEDIKDKTLGELWQLGPTKHTND
jgi:hypothetical protein